MNINYCVKRIIDFCYQAFSLGLGDQFEEIKEAYIQANKLMGDLIKVRTMNQKACTLIKTINMFKNVIKYYVVINVIRA